MVTSTSLWGFLMLALLSTRSLQAFHNSCRGRSLASSSRPPPLGQFIRTFLPGNRNKDSSRQEVRSGQVMSSSSSSSTSTATTIPMRDGTLHPLMGYGTYKVGFIPASASSAVAAASTSSSTTPPERTAKECVADALSVGYRFLECAQFYGNEAQVGQALAESGLPRSELFLCSKVWTTTIEQGPAAIRAQCEKSLADLQTDYLDLYLIHWPVPRHHIIAYQTLLELKREGKIRGVGVSNYAWEDYLELKTELQLSEQDLPLVNQIEVNPFLYRMNTIAKFQQDGVVIQSYRSLRDGKAFADPTLLALAAQYGKTPAQILGRWCVQHSFVYLPKSVRKERMQENAAIWDFVLTNEDMDRLDQLTEPGALDKFLDLYRKCVNRDTSKDGTMEGVKMNITVD